MRTATTPPSNRIDTIQPESPRAPPLYQQALRREPLALDGIPYLSRRQGSRLRQTVESYDWSAIRLDSFRRPCGLRRLLLQGLPEIGEPRPQIRDYPWRREPPPGAERQNLLPSSPIQTLWPATS